MNNVEQERIDALLAYEQEMQEKARQAEETPDEELRDLARLLQERDASELARRRERWRKVREAVPALLALAGLALAALTCWWLFR